MKIETEIDKLNKKIELLEKSMISNNLSFGVKLKEQKARIEKYLEEFEALEEESADKSTITLTEDIIVSEHTELKNKLVAERERVQAKLDKLKNKTDVYGISYINLLKYFDAQLAIIKTFEDTTNNLIAEYEINIKTLDDLIATAKTNKSISPELEARKENLLNLNVERTAARELLQSLIDSKEGFKKKLDTFFEVLKAIRQDFYDIIDGDALFNSEFISKVVQALPDFSIQDRFNNKNFTGADLEDIFSYVLENNGDSVTFINNEGQSETLVISLDALGDIGNEEYKDKFDALDEVLIAFDKITVQALVAAKNNLKISTANIGNKLLEKAISEYSQNNYTNSLNSFKVHLMLGKVLYDPNLTMYFKATLKCKDTNIEFGELNPHYSSLKSLKDSYLNKMSNGETVTEDNINKLMTYQSHYKIGFGNYSGSTIQEIINIDAHYILWCIINLFHFSLSPTLFLQESFENEIDYLEALEINLVKIELVHLWTEEDHIYQEDHPSYGQWLEDEFGDDAETAYWNMD